MTDAEYYHIEKTEFKEIVTFYDQLIKRCKTPQRAAAIRRMKLYSLDGLVHKYSCFFPFIDNDPDYHKAYLEWKAEEDKWEKCS